MHVFFSWRQHGQKIFKNPNLWEVFLICKIVGVASGMIRDPNRPYSVIYYVLSVEGARGHGGTGGALGELSEHWVREGGTLCSKVVVLKKTLMYKS